jgi:hypothetical protein
MKKIPKRTSVTAIIEVEENGTVVWKGSRCSGAEIGTMREFGFVVPKEKYRVTYKVNPRGKLLVSYSLACADVRPFGPDSDESDFVNTCFLPKNWHGLRVSRRVEAIR